MYLPRLYHLRQVDRGRNPVAQIERPTIAALAPTELTPEARYVLHSLVERQHSLRLTAIVALAYWSALRISEIAALSLAGCTINQRAGSLRIMDAKGGKTRTIDLHNAARRALYAYLYENAHAPDVRDPESSYIFTGQRAAWLRRQGRPDHIVLTIFLLPQNSSAKPPAQAPRPDYPACLLIGEWEAQIPGNNYRLKVDWDENENKFKGYLTRQGDDLEIRALWWENIFMKPVYLMLEGLCVILVSIEPEAVVYLLAFPGYLVQQIH